jgi:hypothetical protein
MGVNSRDSGTHKGPEHKTSTMLSNHPSRPVPMTVMQKLEPSGNNMLSELLASDKDGSRG